MKPRTALIFGLVSAAAGLGIGVFFLVRIGLPMAPLMAIGAVLVLGYTDILARSGVGEVAAGLGLGGLPVIGAALVQGGGIGPAAWAAALPATFMTFNLLLLNEFPDEAADRQGGRKNLVLLLGRKPAAMVYAAAALATPVAIVIAILVQALPLLCLIAALPSLLLAKPLAWAFSDTTNEVPIPALGANVIWNLATNTLLAATLVAAHMMRS